MEACICLPPEPERIGRAELPSAAASRAARDRGGGPAADRGGSRCETRARCRPNQAPRQKCVPAANARCCPLPPMHVEPVRVGEPPGIAVRRGQDGADQRTGLEVDAPEGDRSGRLPRRGADRPGPPQRLLHRRPHERTVGRSRPGALRGARGPPTSPARSRRGAPAGRRTASASCSPRSPGASSDPHPGRTGASTTAPSRPAHAPGGRGPSRSPLRAPRSRRPPAPASPDRPRSSRGRASCPRSSEGCPPTRPSSSPSRKRSDRTDIGSQYSRNRSARPRAAKPSISSCASRGIMPCVRSSTSRGRKGVSTIRRIRS